MTDPKPTAETFAAAVAASPTLRRIGYDEVQALAESAAVRLIDALGRDAIRDATLVPIPRAGFVVAGLLSYLLDLRPEQVGPSMSPSGDGLVVLVDDCALSGLRTRQALDALTERSAAVVHLLSPAPLRKALRNGDPRVRAVVAGDDLAVTEMSAESQETWSRELGPSRVWIGKAEAVSFPWGEPEGWLWDAGENRLLPRPHSTPPHRSLKSRAALVGMLRHQPASDWTLPDDLRWQEQDGAFWLARPGGLVASLEGTAADAWRHLAGWGRLDAAAQELSQLWGIGLERTEQDLRHFAEGLRSQGFLLGPAEPNGTDASGS